MIQGVLIELNQSERKVLNYVSEVFKKPKPLIKVISKYITVVTDGISQCINAFLGGNPSQTIACRAQRNSYKRFWGKIKRLLDILMSPMARDHCEKATIRDLERSKSVLRNDMRIV